MTPQPSDILPSDSPSVEKDGRQPRRGNPPRLNVSSLKRSRKLVLFWLRREFESNLGENYLAKVTEYQSRLKLEELESALELYSKLIVDPRGRSRFLAQYREVRIPRLQETRKDEIRRIGVGYRDKGSLRPHHTKGRDLGEEVIWAEDIKFLLPPDLDLARWITRKEVLELCGGLHIFHLSMVAIQAQTSGFYQLPFRSNHQR